MEARETGLKTIKYNGKEYDFESTTILMDREIREALHMEMAPCSEQEFFNEYIKRHYAKFGEEFCID